MTGFGAGMPPLMAIVDADAARHAGWSVAALAAAYLEGGATLLQVRAKEAPGGWLLEAAATIVASARRSNARVIVNDRADIALMSSADGVHVGQGDLDPHSVRRIVGPGAIVGLSTHNMEQIDAALDAPVDYVAIGPVFDTGTKDTGYASLGLEPVRQAAARARARGVPLIAIGGVTLETAPDVLHAGASVVAVIGDLLRGDDPARRVREYLARLTV